MTSPAYSVLPEDTVETAARIMYLRNVKRLPVVDADGRLAGIVSRADVLAVYSRTDADIAEEIRTGILSTETPANPGTFDVSVKAGVATIVAGRKPANRDAPSSAGPGTSRASSRSATALSTRFPRARPASTSWPASRLDCAASAAAAPGGSGIRSSAGRSCPALALYFSPRTRNAAWPPMPHSAQSRRHAPSVCFRNVSYSQFCGSWIDGHEMGAKWVPRWSGTGPATTGPRPEGGPS